MLTPFTSDPSVVETSDAAAGTSTAYSLVVGQTARGQLTSGSDHDWYKVNLTAGQVYTFAETGVGTNNVVDPYLRLYAPDGVTVVAQNDDSLPGENSILTYTAPTTGTYYIDAGSYNNAGAGTYGISVAAGTKASFDVAMGAGVIDTDLSWSSVAGSGTTVTYGFRVSQTYDPGGPFTSFTAAEMAAVQAIMQLWSDVSGVTFTLVNPGGYTNDATILFGNYSANDGAGAYAYYPGSRAASSQAGDVWANTNSVSTTSLPFGSYSFFALMHEVGHAVGLSHPGLYNAGVGVSITYANNAQFVQDTQQYSVMSYFDESYTGANMGGYPDTPQLFDVYALQQIYGANYSTRSGNTIYGFGSNAGSIYDFSVNTTPGLCIWDGGGTDTFDCSGFSQAQTINLTPGTFSSIAGLTGNVSIAIGAVLEVAIGGSGADTIVGNSADNSLQGGRGNDTLDGITGFDSAVFSGLRSAYIINSLGGGTFQVVGPDGTDTLFNIDQAVFDDQVVALTAANQPNLTITGVGMNAGTLSFQISNIGAATAGASATGIYLSTDSTITTQDLLLATAATPSLAPGATDGESWSISFPGDLSSGTYYIGAVADYNGQIGESDEANNASSGLPVILGNNSANTLNGTSSNDAMFGLGGNDTLNGGAGADSMVGGIGNDTYWVDNTADAVTEDANAGTDDVLAFISYELPSTVENLTLHATAGNIYGYGNAGNNTIIGNSGNNTIYGGDGADTMIGGAGDDVYFVDSYFDTITEGFNEGNDTVYANPGYTLGPNVENLILLGVATGTATGNSLNNIITGNAANNTLYGSSGDDTFVFHNMLNGSTNIDVLGDFNDSNDTVALDHEIFTALQIGTIDPTQFYVGASAHQSSDRIIYDQANGDLYYDADGNGGGAAVLFANNYYHGSMTHADFVVI